MIDINESEFVLIQISPNTKSGEAEMYGKTLIFVGIMLQFGVTGCVQSATSTTEVTDLKARGSSGELVVVEKAKECEAAGKHANVVLFPETNRATVTCE